MPTLMLETGAGLADANSYASLAEGDAYHDAHPDAAGRVVWADAPDQQMRALIMATKVIDAEVRSKLGDFLGYPTTTTQALSWPRAYCPRPGRVNPSAPDLAGFPPSQIPAAYFLPNDEIPAFLKDATIECARQLLVSNRTADDSSRGISRVVADTVEVDFSSPGAVKRVLPDFVRTLLMPYCNGGGGFIPTVRV